MLFFVAKMPSEEDEHGVLDFRETGDLRAIVRALVNVLCMVARRWFQASGSLESSRPVSPEALVLRSGQRHHETITPLTHLFTIHKQLGRLLKAFHLQPLRPRAPGRCHREDYVFP